MAASGVEREEADVDPLLAPGAAKDAPAPATGAGGATNAPAPAAAAASSSAGAAALKCIVVFDFTFKAADLQHRYPDTLFLPGDEPKDSAKEVKVKKKAVKLLTFKSVPAAGATPDAAGDSDDVKHLCRLCRCFARVLGFKSVFSGQMGGGGSHYVCSYKDLQTAEKDFNCACAKLFASSSPRVMMTGLTLAWAFQLGFVRIYEITTINGDFEAVGAALGEESVPDIPSLDQHPPTQPNPVAGLAKVDLAKLTLNFSRAELGIVTKPSYVTMADKELLLHLHDNAIL